jgi:protein SCO1/2
MMSARARLAVLYGMAAISAMLMGVLLVAVVGAVRQAMLISSVEQEGIKLGTRFALVDQNGARTTEATHAGKVRLVFFGFTSCPDICPTTLTDISALLDELGDKARDVVPILVTVDPERDTAPILKNYTAMFHPNVVALAGTPEEIAAVARSFRVVVKKVPLENGGYTIDHSTGVLVFDRTGLFRGMLDSHEERADWRAKLERLIAEPAPTTS